MLDTETYVWHDCELEHMFYFGQVKEDGGDRKIMEKVSNRNVVIKKKKKDDTLIVLYDIGYDKGRIDYV